MVGQYDSNDTLKSQGGLSMVPLTVDYNAARTALRPRKGTQNLRHHDRTHLSFGVCWNHIYMPATQGRAKTFTGFNFPFFMDWEIVQGLSYG